MICKQLYSMCIRIFLFACQFKSECIKINYTPAMTVFALQTDEISSDKKA